MLKAGVKIMDKKD